jgi:hypothetical protein
MYFKENELHLVMYLVGICFCIKTSAVISFWNFLLVIRNIISVKYVITL